MISAMNNCGCGNTGTCTTSRCGNYVCEGNCGGCGRRRADACAYGNVAGQLGALYNTRVHITTFTCTLDVVLLDICDGFVRVLDYATGKIYLLRIDCICMIEQPIVPGCGCGCGC